MDSIQHAWIRAAFLRARTLSGEERTDFLSRLDPALSVHVQALLAHDPTGPGGLQPGDGLTMAMKAMLESPRATGPCADFAS